MTGEGSTELKPRNRDQEGTASGSIEKGKGNHTGNKGCNQLKSILVDLVVNLTSSTTNRLKECSD